jgi:hypothetical protein
MPFIRFMSNPIGRIARVVAGIVLAIVGIATVHGAVGLALVVVGAVVFLAGAVNFCIFAPIFRAPLLARNLPPNR